MSDDLNNKIKQITDILGQENIPDNVKGLLSLLTSSGAKDETSQKPEEIPDVKNVRNERSELDENVEMIRKVKKVMDRLNTVNDPRVNLLSAIKPFLSNNRQKKLGSCIKMLQVSSLAKFIDEPDK